MSEWKVLTCPKCSWVLECGPAQMLEWLKRADMVRRDVGPEPDLLAELFRAAAGKFVCPQCQAKGLIVRDCDENDDDWNVHRVCEVCKKPIAAERLEFFPNTRLCVECQGRDDRGESSSAPEYCPKCGSIMTIRQSRGQGVTRYVQSCPACGGGRR